MKKTLTIIACLLFSLTAFAQKDPAAKKVLDATASKLSSMKNIKAQFEISQFRGATATGETMKGAIFLSGKKYKVEAPGVTTTWFDGKTQWVYMHDTEEVNVSTPTKQEQATMNPYAFIGLYKQGYDYSMKEVKVLGTDTYEIRLTAQQASAEIPEAVINISKNNEPISVRVRQGKQTWTRIRIFNLQGKQKFANDTFTFPRNEYTNAEIIDLR